jgi:hypothetical protein
MPRNRRNAALLVGAVVLVVLGWTSADRDSPTGTGTPPPAGSTDPTPAATPASPAAPSASGVLAADALRALPVKGRAPKTGYSRDQFGQSWRDLDRNGCDQRNDVLRRDLTGITVDPGTRGCVVLRGVLVSPYSGRDVVFTRGTSTSREVPIDHVVALSDAWQKGAQQWTAQRREQLANDFLELVATDVATNSSKSDGDAATWLPPHKPARCAYVARQVAVKTAYGLWVTQAEHDAIERVLATCPDERLPTSTEIPLAPS